MFKSHKYKYIKTYFKDPKFPNLPFIGLKKLKNESLGTCLVIVRTVPRPLCFCFFLIVLTVTFFPFFQSMVHLETAGEKQHFNTRHQGKEGTEQQSNNIKAKMAYHSLDKAA